jgi:opacity protein-like surface antigen
MNRPRYPVSLLILLTLALLTSSIAKSDDFSRSGAYIGASGAFGISLFENDLEASSPRNLKLGDSAGFQIKMGYRLNEWLALEAQYEWLNEFVVTQTNEAIYESTAVAEFRPQTVTANLKLILPLGRVEPHLILGVGLGLWEGKVIRSGFSTSNSAFAGRVGAGVDFHLTPSWILTASGTAVLGTAQFEQEAGAIPFSVGDLYYVSFAAGVAYHF